MGERKGLPVGTRLGDGNRYEIRRRVGQGAMAEVYEAADRRLNGRIVAVKTLSAVITDHPFSGKMRALFIEEARALSRVRDDNVVAVLDSGTAPDGNPFMVMEFLNGRDLAGLLKEQKQLSIERTVDIMLAVCAGVHACHLAGIIHRDLKPANIFLEQTPKGEQPKVLDFGVAKLPISRDQTRTDLIVGTPSYMSPEQALGTPADERSDQYSIGALLYRCLTGRSPQGVLAKPREIRPDFPESLEFVLLRAMDPIPANRFPSVHDLGQSLLPFASSLGSGRWKPYYAAAPVAVRATLSEPLEAPGPGATDSDVGDLVMTTIAAHDFAVHERTTDTAAATQIPEIMKSSVPRVDQSDDRVPSSSSIGPATLTSAQRVSAEPEPPSAVPASTAGVALGPGEAPDPITAGSAARAERANMFERRPVLAASVAGVVVLLGGFGVIHLGRGRYVQPTAPSPPPWTHSLPPVDVQPSTSTPHGPTVLHAVQVPLGPAPEAPALPSDTTEFAGSETPLLQSPEKATKPLQNTRARTRRGPLRPRADRATDTDGRRRWTGTAGTNKPLVSKYPAVGNPSDSKYPAMQ